MTEQQWMECRKPEPMLKYALGKSSDRKLRLYAVACIHQIPLKFADNLLQRAIQVAEQYVDGLATERELHIVHKAHEESMSGCFGKLPYLVKIAGWNLTWNKFIEDRADWSSTENANAVAASRVLWSMSNLSAGLVASDSSVEVPISIRSTGIRAELFRDLFGNPFRPITLNPTWLTPTVKQLAALIYEERQFDKMPLLGDALEEAGCDLEEVLQHCRGGGEHVRGCWVVDKVLGKE